MDFKKVSKKGLISIIATFAFVFAMCAVSFAAEGSASFNLDTTVTSAVSDISTQLMGTLGIVIPGLIGFFGAKLAAVKALTFIKTITNKA